MINPKTPGVYISEVNAFGTSIVENETAVPIFFGFTEKAVDSEGKPLNKVNGSTIVTAPVLVHSMLEYKNAFGGPDTTGSIYVTTTIDDNGKVQFSAENKNSDGTEPYQPGFMYPSILSYFTNGGGSCYVVSLGSYSDFEPSFASKIDAEKDGIDSAIKMAEKTTLIVPTDLIRFGTEQYYNWGALFIDFGGEEKKYFTILDVIQGDPDSSSLNQDDIDHYRNLVTTSHPSYTAAYFPYLKSLTAYSSKDDLSNVYLNDDPITPETPNELVKEVKTFLSTFYIHMPPSPYMAGIYSKLDNAKGVWTPPANVSPIGVSEPVVTITDKEQEDLNVDAVAGKSINAIRSFPERGTLVWGARTNDGNSIDWRYINIRRLCTSIETDVSTALESYVFKPNVHNTWVEVKTMIESYLFGLYGQGAFAGTTPATSYQVLIGKGETMTDEDILNGYMRVSLMIAPVRPAEFIVLTFSQMVGQ